MAYRYEKADNGKYDLIIDGFENGIGPSPYKGLASIKNLNIKYQDGVAYVNYKRQACTFNGATVGRPQYSCQSPAGVIYFCNEDSATATQLFKQDAANGSSFTLLTGSSVASRITGLAFWNNYLFVFKTNGAIEICGDGSGDAGVTSSNWNVASTTTGVWPIPASAAITLTATAAAGDTSATLASYTDAQGNSRAFWNGPTGYYRSTMAGVSGQQLLVFLTQNSTAVSWSPPLNSNASRTTLTVRAFSSASSAAIRQTLILARDGDLYFCNGDAIGTFRLNTNQIFSKGNMLTFTFNAASLLLPPTEIATWPAELRGDLIVAGKQRLYPWDTFSSRWKLPIPMDEQIYKTINILNNLYVFAGNKGNIYISNGYSIDRFTKIPDCLAGNFVDPAWNIGGVMQHRQKLYFQALGSNSALGTKLVQGTMSVDLDTQAINLENENSSPVDASSGATGILIDISDTSIGYDKYYSGGEGAADFVDFNDTTLYSNNEPAIETDLIPVGTFLQNKTFGSAEFKLDQPLRSGDSITLYVRNSLSDTYVSLGTTTSALLSFAYTQMPKDKFQWFQFKVTMSCNSSANSSSFVRLRELRIR